MFEQKEPIIVQFFKLLSALMKVHSIPHVIFETTRSGFTQTLHHCSVSWKIIPLYFFSWNLISFWWREPIKMPNLRLSISPNVDLDRLLLSLVSAKKVQRSCVSWHWRLMQNLNKNWSVASKMTRTWWILIQALKSLKNV